MKKKKEDERQERHKKREKRIHLTFDTENRRQSVRTEVLLPFMSQGMPMVSVYLVNYTY